MTSQYHQLCASSIAMPAAKVKAKTLVRNLRPDEPLPPIPTPDHSPIGFESLPLDHEWIWVMERDSKIVGLLIGGHLHGLLCLARMVIAPDAPPLAPMLLLRRALSDAQARGCLGYLTFLDDAQPAEVKCMRIATRAGGNKLISVSGVWVIGSIENKY